MRHAVCSGLAWPPRDSRFATKTGAGLPGVTGSQPRPTARRAGTPRAPLAEAREGLAQLLEFHQALAQSLPPKPTHLLDQCLAGSGPARAEP